MKRILGILLSLILLTACQGGKNPDPAQEKPVKNLALTEERLIQDLKKIDQVPKKNPGDLPVYSLHIVKTLEDKDTQSVLAYVDQASYSFSEGIFKQESGYAMPMEFVYNKKDGSLEDLIQAQDGTEYYPSILKMARGDEDLADTLAGERLTSESYDKLMWNLRSLAQDRGLENYLHDLKDIPGYEEDVVYIREDPHGQKGTVGVAKKADYEKALSRLGTENWTYCEGVIHHTQSGISLRGTIDYFEGSGQDQ